MTNWNRLLTEEEGVDLGVVDVFLLNIEEMLYYDTLYGIYYWTMSSFVGLNAASVGLLTFMSLEYVYETYVDEEMEVDAIL